jgi:hypothetical protein
MSMPFAINVDVNGYEKLGVFMLYLDKEQFKSEVTNIVANELSKVAESLQQDPNIPEDYKKSIFVSVNEQTGTVTLGVFIKEQMKWKRFGKVMEWGNYICPVEDTWILTPIGLVKAKYIMKGNRLIGKHCMNEVMETTRLLLNEPIINIKPYYFPSIKVTGNHKVSIARRKWKYANHGNRGIEFKGPEFVFSYEKAHNIQNGDYLVLPNIGKDEYDISFNVNSLKFILDENIAKLFGWFIAEGSTNKAQVFFALNKLETNNIKEVKSLIQSITGKQPKEYDNVTSKVVYFNSVNYAKMFRRLFGHNAKQKHLPYNFLYWKNNILKSLLGTYSKGDGYKHGNITTCSTRSNELALQLLLSYWKLGSVASFREYSVCDKYINGRKLADGIDYIIENNNSKRSMTYRVKDGKWLVRVNKVSIEDYNGEIVPIETSDGNLLLPFESLNCPMRKYYGGELAPKYNGPSYIKEKFTTIANEVKINIKNNIMAYIKSGMG